MSPTKNKDKRPIAPTRAVTVKQKDKKAASFYLIRNICLENFPEGTFTHKRITPGEAKLLVDEAHGEKRLFCVSRDDLLAPYRDKEPGNHDALRRILTKHFGIVLAFETSPQRLRS